MEKVNKNTDTKHTNKKFHIYDIITKFFNVKKYKVVNICISSNPNEWVHLIKERKCLIFFKSTEHCYFGYYHTKRLCDKLNGLCNEPT